VEQVTGQIIDPAAKIRSPNFQTKRELQKTDLSPSLAGQLVDRIARNLISAKMVRSSDSCY